MSGGRRPAPTSGGKAAGTRGGSRPAVRERVCRRHCSPVSGFSVRGGKSYCLTRLSQIQRARRPLSAAKRLDPEPVRLAVIAAVRHQFTNYDTLLLQGIERHEARALVSSAVERKLGEWSGGERVTEHRLSANRRTVKR